MSETKIKIQAGDKVKFINLTIEQAGKIAQLTGRLYSKEAGIWFANYSRKYLGGQEIFNNARITVENIRNTEKTNTEFASCIVRFAGCPAMRFFIQTRYLEFVDRKHRHPLTKIFVEWWKPGLLNLNKR